MSQRSSMAWLGCIALVGFSLSACVGTVEIGGGGNGGGGNGGGGPLPKADKIDLLLVVDNSRSMADKQEILALVTADLVQSVTNPPCVDANGNVGQTPASPLDPCPAGQTRRHAPVTDMHVGVISTSIGGHGADSCPNDDPFACQPNTNVTNNDKAHLLNRTDACGVQTSLPTWQNQGFLAWDLQGAMSPVGISDPLELAKGISALVTGVGQVGCGYESQLESWYRFLVDPAPYESITVVNSDATPSGTDTLLLTQRASFLRPDSMLVILQLTDENDCSINESGQNFMAAQIRNPGGMPFRLPRPRQECAINPNDPCCKSCGQDQGNCPVDPTCTGPDGQLAMLTEQEDQINLRCWDQKRRFGIDFLYPVDRYINAVTQGQIADRNGNLVPNPIFSDLNPSDGNSGVRDPGLVFVASISGVPWQLIARDPADLTQGFQNSSEMMDYDVWNNILGDWPNTPPMNPHMIESIAPRSGLLPGDPYNGGDRTISSNDDLQYACIFPLATPRDCSVPDFVACDCADPNNNNPLCAPDPNTGVRTMQVAAKAYPSPRTMQVIKGLGNQGVLTSICPAEIDDSSRTDYAYRPVVRALVERMITRL